MDRPYVTPEELIDAGMSIDEVNGHCLGAASSARGRLWPCSLVWGMGFAWSGLVAQESLLAVCARAGSHSSALH